MLLVTCTNISDTGSKAHNQFRETETRQNESNVRTATDTQKKRENETNREMMTLTEGLRLQLAEKEVWIDDPKAREAAVHFFEELAGSKQLAHIILEQTAEHQVPAPLAFALVWAESSFDPRAVNQNRSSVDRGLFQLNSRSFPELEEAEFFDPETNARNGVAYLSECLDDGENEIVALAMYNAGRRRVNERGTPKMTLDYISKVLDYRERIEERLRIYVEHVEERYVKANTPETLAYVVDSKRRTK